MVFICTHASYFLFSCKWFFGIQESAEPRNITFRLSTIKIDILRSVNPTYLLWLKTLSTSSHVLTVDFEHVLLCRDTK